MKKSTWLPCLMLIYLGVMSYIGRGEYQQGHYAYYFGIIGASLFIIALLRIFLKKREHFESMRKQDLDSQHKADASK